MQKCSKQETTLVNITTDNQACSKSSYILVKGHELDLRREIEDDLEKGLHLTKKRKLDDGIIKPEFVDLKDDPLGSVPSILFWNDQQRQIYTRVTSMQHTLLVGDYGTGLNYSHEVLFKYHYQARP